jgi:hypothetical protein
MSAKRFCFVCGKERPSNWFAEGWNSVQAWITRKGEKIYFSEVACREHSKQLIEAVP